MPYLGDIRQEIDMLLKNGCPGCEKEWNAPYAEGQCSRCKRCLQCCGKVKVALSC